MQITKKVNFALNEEERKRKQKKEEKISKAFDTTYQNQVTAKPRTNEVQFVCNLKQQKR